MSDVDIRTQLLSAPPTVSLDLANRALGIGRSTGYTLAKNGRYPCRLIKAGDRKVRVVTADLLGLLGLTAAAA